MNVLSLFGGIETGLIALKELGIKVDKYYCSEIDKYASSVARYLHPEIIELGCITSYKSWDLPKIDLILAGPPCQGFSIAGKGLNWDDPRSELFFTAIEILWKYKPEKFLFENVASMKKEIRKEIDELMEVDSVMINSALVSAQNRKRLYWCNWDVEQPEDKGVLLKDITLCGSNQLNQRPRGKNSGGLREDKSPSMSSSSWVDNVHVIKGGFLKRVKESGDIKKGFTAIDPDKSLPMLSRQYSNWRGTLTLDSGILRKLTPIECERLQTLPDETTRYGVVSIYGEQKIVEISNSQRYRLLGNGWTEDVIKHLLKGFL